jgi:chromosomal replication initiator protein
MIALKEPSWQAVSEQLLEQIGQPHYDLWIRPLRAKISDDQTLRLVSPNDFHLDYVRRNYLPTIQGVVEAVMPGFRFELAVDEVKEAAPSVTTEPAVSEPAAPTPMSQREQPNKPRPHPLLNPDYTFDAFVIGTSNQVAHASASSVSQNLGTAFNPLFLVGAAGLGKTHLLHAIGHQVHRDHPKMRIVCMPAGDFMNKYTSAIQQGKGNEFKEKYRRECDLLLIDDIHALAGREGTQEEFFHIFNSLHDSRKQIVLTSDKYPKDMAGLEQRLRSRFEWGLIADIQPPNMETRLAIIRKKAEHHQMSLPDDVAVYLATMATTSVRDLEGHLNRLRAFSKFENRPIDLEFARKTLASLMGQAKVVSCEDIIKVVAETYNVRVNDMKSSSRKASITEPRHVAMFVTREETGLSFPEIGARFGGRNHATVINACDNVRNRMLADAQFAALVGQIRKAL